MWAQLIGSRIRSDVEPADVAERVLAVHEHVRAAEQPGSGLLRTLLLQDQSDPHRVYTLVVFESEEKARAREQDPRRAEHLEAARSALAGLYDGAAEFTDLTVITEWEN
jgi:heme-degrading monooxygenase HmoA